MGGEGGRSATKKQSMVSRKEAERAVGDPIPCDCSCGQRLWDVVVMFAHAAGNHSVPDHPPQHREATKEEGDG